MSNILTILQNKLSVFSTIFICNYLKTQNMFYNMLYNMCVGATKGTYRRDIKIIVNHDYIKQCIIFAKNFLG